MNVSNLLTNVAEAPSNIRRSVDELCRALQASQRTMPRFLFRGWDHLSGGDSRLNSANKIIPKAFFNNSRSPVHLCEHPHGREMVDDHLNTRKGDFRTEFSSWSTSLDLATAFAGYYVSGSVSVMDRDLLTEQVAVYWVPDLWGLGLACAAIDVEWLVHGVVKSPGLFSFQVNTHIHRGLNPQSASTNTPWDLADVTSFDIGQATRFARAFLGLDNREASSYGQLSPEFRGVFYFLILTWIARIIKTHKPNFSERNLQALIGAISQRVGAEIPEDLRPGFARHFPAKYKQCCNDGSWTRSLILLGQQHHGGRANGGTAIVNGTGVSLPYRSAGLVSNGSSDLRGRTESRL